MSYGQLGLIEICAAFYTYFAIMAESGFWPARLMGIRDMWNSRVNDIEDSFGQEWVGNFCVSCFRCKMHGDRNLICTSNLSVRLFRTLDSDRVIT